MSGVQQSQVVQFTRASLVSLCSFADWLTCSHVRAVEFFTESLHCDFTLTKCQSLQAALQVVLSLFCSIHPELLCCVVLFLSKGTWVAMRNQIPRSHNAIVFFEQGQCPGDGSHQFPSLGDDARGLFHCQTPHWPQQCENNLRVQQTNS